MTGDTSMEIEMIASAVQSALAVYGVLFLMTSIAYPAWFLDNLAIDELDRQRARNKIFQNNGGRWLFYFKAASAALGLGVLIYSALSAVVAIIPTDWGQIDEDGEWHYIRSSIQFTGAFYGAVMLGGKLEDNAKSLIWSKINARSRLALLDTLTKSNIHFAVADCHKSISYILARATENVEKQLQPDELAPRNWATKAQIEEKEHLLAMLQTYAKALENHDEG